MAEADLCEPLVITEDGDKTESCKTGEQNGEKETEPPQLQSKGGRIARSESQREEVPLSRTEAKLKKEDQEEQREEQNKQHCENEAKQEDLLCKSEQEKAQLDTKKAHRLSPEFPDALFELLCTLQEGRRMNDQRCSFTALEPTVRRRCHSEPNTTKPANRVVFSSMTSLQKEEFFDLVATAQARRLNDQRAQLERSPPPKSKSRSFRGSIRQLTLVKKPPEPAPAPKEELYSMILHTQAQGRLEDQRSRAPGPMDDEVFFSLLLRVQGGRMDEQRTELPCLLHT